MAYYFILGLLLVNLILLAKAWPPESTEGWYYKGNRQMVKQGEFRKTDPVQINSRKGKNDDVVFPDERSHSRSSLPKHKPIFSANGKGINCIDGMCAKAKDYPYDRIQNILKELPDYDKLFGFLEGTIVNTSTRFSDKDNLESLCATTFHSIYPMTSKNEYNIEKFIINVPGKQQGVAFETCQENAKCIYHELFPMGYESKCVQKYAKVRLLALGEEGSPVVDTFVMPSCCVCGIKQKFN